LRIRVGLGQSQKVNLPIPYRGLRRFISTMASMTSLEGPFGPGFLPPPGEYSSRYFRSFRALWNENRVEGLMIIAALTMRLGFRNNDQKPRRIRSRVERFGARCLGLLWIISCCFKIRFSAMTVRLPSGRNSLATVVSRWKSR